MLVTIYWVMHHTRTIEGWQQGIKDFLAGTSRRTLRMLITSALKGAMVDATSTPATNLFPCLCWLSLRVMPFATRIPINLG